jgi:hypothetical protein
MTAELITFAIPSFRRSQIEVRLAKLAKKAAKYGNGDITIAFGETTVRKVTTEYGPRLVEYVTATVSGSAPQIQGWQLLARVEMLEGAETLIHHVPGSGVQLERRFRTHGGQCEHCNAARRRNDVYVLTDGQKQIAVGRTCLRDFLGTDDPKAIVSRAQFFEELTSTFDEEDSIQFGSYANVYDLHSFLTAAAAVIREKGYISKAKQADTGRMSTGDEVLMQAKGIATKMVETTEEDALQARATIELFRSSADFGNEYLDNIRVLFNQDLVRDEHASIVASSIVAARRQQEQQARAATDVDSKFVGQVKDRLRGIELQIERIITLGQSQWGTSYLHLMKDRAGNKFSWITTSKIEAAEGSAVLLDASIKEHKMYKGICQTVLTRVKTV